MKILEEMGTAIHNVERIEGRIREIALEHCVDYPGVRKMDALEHLHAINCALLGQAAALKDWATLGKAKGVTDEEFNRILDENRL